jgi:hypothetical protein
VDFRRFLDRSEEVAAPVVDGYAWLRDRRARVQGEAVGNGWWRVQVQGRQARPIAAAPPEEVAAALAALPRMRGHVLLAHGGVQLVDSRAHCHAVDLPPADEVPPVLAPATARRWPTGDLLLWDQVEWEGEREEAARRALEDRDGLGAVKGVPASLRAAFGFATALLASRALAIPVEPAEVRRWVGEIADQGYARAEAALRALAQERASLARPAVAVQRRTAAPEPAMDMEAEVEDTLRAAGARLLGVRRVGGGVVEVRWMFEGQRLISLVSDPGLRVIDSGVCLSGSDDLVTLDSLPGVIREALDTDALVITRHHGY